MKHPPPTAVRHLVVLVTALMAVILYFHRFCISFAEIFIKEELRLSDDQIALVLSMFFFTYALGQVPSGWLTDRFGARIMLTSYILLWSLFTGLTGMAFGFAALLIYRCAFGVFQAGAYPTSASLISKWVPFQNRGMASSFVAIGGRVGGVLAPLVTGFLIVWLVPVTVSSTLDKNDLIDVPRLCYDIMYGSNTSKPPAKSAKDNPAARVGAILRKLSPQLESTIAGVAQQYANELNKRRAAAEQKGEKTDKLSADVAAPPKQITDSIAAELNKLLMRDDIYDKAAFAEVRLEKEAKRLLAARPKKQLSMVQTTRMNRLLLESVYPKSIKKVYGHGWRTVMYIYGAVGLLVAGLFWICFRNRPSDHPLCNESELKLIESSRPAEATQPHGEVGAVPMRWILRSPSLWLSCASQFFTNIGWVILVTWAARYFLSAHGVGVETRAVMVAIPTAVGWLGMICGGFLTDSLVRLIGLRWGRALPMSLSRFSAMAAYLFCLYQWNSPWVFVAAFSVVAFSTDLGTSAVWAFKQDVGGRHVGSILGWGNMWGNFGAFLATRYLISLVGEDENWNLVFITCAVAFMLSGFAALFINATRPIVPKDEESN